jgi:hypothetical protein
MELLKSQKNLLFDYIEEYDLSPSLFELQKFTSDNRQDTFRINFKTSDYFFDIFQGTWNNYSIIYSPGDNIIESTIDNISWQSVCNNFLIWLQNLKNELEMPDKWEQLLQEEQFFNTPDDEELNIKYNYQEILQIETSFNKLKEELKKLKLSPVESSNINKKLDYILERSKFLGKVDWKNIAIGTFTGIAGNLAISHPPETVELFVKLVKLSFKTILLLN